MELRSIKGRAYVPPVAQVDAARATKAAATSTAAAPSRATGATRAASDRIDIALSKEKMQGLVSLYGPEQLRAQIDSANAQAKAAAKQGETQRKCMLIAQRIMAGDRLDPRDLQYLMENDMRSYQLVMSLRRENPDGEKHKRISSDEESETQSSAVSADAPSSALPPATEAAPTPEGGGESL